MNFVLIESHLLTIRVQLDSRNYKVDKANSITLFIDTWKDEIIKFQTNNKKIIDGTVVFLFILIVISLSEVDFLFLGCFLKKNRMLSQNII